jgi:predicted RNA-binding protein YlqC (UPF0109 family)
MLKDLIKYFVIHLVDHKERVSIQEIKSVDKVLIEIKVSASDLAKVIGKEGRTFRALRSLVHSIEDKHTKDIVVDITA